jgi:hypothetical protein
MVLQREACAKEVAVSLSRPRSSHLGLAASDALSAEYTPDITEVLRERVLHHVMLTNAPEVVAASRSELQTKDLEVNCVQARSRELPLKAAASALRLTG